MKKPDKIQEPYINLLCRALQLFYENDAKAMFDKPQAKTKLEAGGKGEKIKIVNERAMAGCVYRYMWCMMHQKISDIPASDIDIEYDRMIKDESEYYEKEIACECERVNCSKRSHCIKVIVDEIQQRRGLGNSEDGGVVAKDGIRAAVRPDIIVHNRNKNGLTNNGLIVEFKKEREKLCADDIKFDIAKLYYFTCQDECTKFHYKVGAMVLLHFTYADVCFMADKEMSLRYKVDAKGMKRVSGESVQDDLLYNAFCGQKCPLSKL